MQSSKDGLNQDLAGRLKIGRAAGSFSIGMVALLLLGCQNRNFHQANSISAQFSEGSEQIRGVILQSFHWYTPSDGNHWRRVGSRAAALAQNGFTAVWLQPAYKGAAGGYDVGYGVYDFYDLGEFDQKGSTRTKYGTKAEFLDAIKALQERRIHVYADIAINHMLGADGTRTVRAYKVNPNSRTERISGAYDIDAWVRFNFPGRASARDAQGEPTAWHHNSFRWEPHHFDGVDWDARTREGGQIYLLEGLNKWWDPNVSSERGNFDYLMGADLDFQHPEVRAHMKDWGSWFSRESGADGVRIDAVKHISHDYLNEWLYHVRGSSGKNLFAVGEYWDYDVRKLDAFLNEVNSPNGTNAMSLFDAPLHWNFYQASRQQGNYDMGAIFNNTLVSIQPARSVTVVDNHDTQPLQGLESPVEPWFKPLAYALILLRQEGYPCVFEPDYFGAEYTDKGGDGKDYTIHLPSHEFLINVFLHARRHFQRGSQKSYFDHRDVIGWTHVPQGGASDAESRGMAVILSDGPGGTKWMEVGASHRGACFRDLTNHFGNECVTINDAGWGEFKTLGGKVSVWVPEEGLSRYGRPR